MTKMKEIKSQHMLIMLFIRISVVIYIPRTDISVTPRLIVTFIAEFVVLVSLIADTVIYLRLDSG